MSFTFKICLIIVIQKTTYIFIIFKRNEKSDIGLHNITLCWLIRERRILLREKYILISVYSYFKVTDAVKHNDSSL